MTFTGDQLGTLFAARTLETYKLSGKPLGEVDRRVVFVSDQAFRKFGHCGKYGKLQDDRGHGTARGL